MQDSEASLFLRQLIEAFRKVGRALRTEMEPGIGWQHLAVLWSLHSRSRGTAELAHIHRVSAPTMSRTLSKLVRRGWVCRRVSEDDRRSASFHLTEEGWLILRETWARAEHKLATILGRLTEQQRWELHRGLELLAQAFSDDEDGPQEHSCPPADPTLR